MKIWEKASSLSRVGVGYPALIDLGDRLIETGKVTAIYRLDDGKNEVERISEVGAYGVETEHESFMLRHRLNRWWWAELPLHRGEELEGEGPQSTAESVG